ncbi:MAG: hypothetical protein AAFW73_26975, partial [Bacteroidota bacterium]
LRHFFRTTEQEELLWGKLYKVVKFAENSTVLERQEIFYESQLAFESPTHRKRRFNDRYDYQDYRIENPCPDRPLREQYNSDGAYLAALYPWLQCEAGAMSSAYQQWLTGAPSPPSLNSCPPDVPTCDCSNLEVLSFGERLDCKVWAEALVAFLDARPNDITDPFFVPDPDPVATEGSHDGARFYEARYARYIEDSNPQYLNSYFIKKTREVLTTYEEDCANPSQQGGSLVATTNTTEYDYFDANYAGYSDSPAYPAFIDDPNFDPTGTADNSGLAWEPSWQLYRVKRYSDEYGGANEAYTMEENFYLYDLANDPRYQRDPNPANPLDYDPKLKSSLNFLWKVKNLHKMRNLPYQSRVTSKAPGQAAIVRSTYYEYRDDWEADDPNFTVTRITNPAGPAAEWPCSGEDISSDGGPVGGTGFDPGVVYNQEGLPCIYYHSDTPPPVGDYQCAMEGFNYWYCQCVNSPGGNLMGNNGNTGDQPGLSPQFGVSSPERPHQQLGNPSKDRNSQRRSRRQSTNPNIFPDPYYAGNAAPFQVQDPYDDPNDAYINNTMQGKIMLVRVQQQVVDGSGNDTPVRYSPTNFSPQYPHPVRLLSQVNSRNRFGQVVEEEDNAGLKTRYVFSPADVIEYEDCYQDSIHNMVLLYLNENPGLPSEVIVGYGRSDAQVTRYEYDDRRRVAKLTDPAGTELTY